jgi:hypothetical protein
MKVHEILPNQQLDENAWRKALAAGAVGATLVGAPKTTDHESPPEPQTRYEEPSDEVVSVGRRPEIPNPGDQLRQSQLTNNIARHYRVNRELVADVVELAFEYEHSEFPKAEDILAVIGVESSFNPESVSRLRQDPAIGLMQVRPGIWNIDPEHLEDVENQIKYGARILTQYYRRLGDKEAALQAYNLGITRFRRGGRNQKYVDKFTQVRNVVNRGAAGGI